MIKDGTIKAETEKSCLKSVVVVMSLNPPAATLQTMQAINKKMDPQKTLKTMQDFQKENMKMGMTEDMSEWRARRTCTLHLHTR